MLKYTLPFLLSISAFANKYTVSFSSHIITDKPFGVEKTINGVYTKQTGSLNEITIAEDKGKRFFGVKTRTALSIGKLQATFVNTNVNLIALGLEKQAYHNFGKFQPLAFLGLGYKFSSYVKGDHNHDYALSSQVYFRLGFELNYLITDKVSAGFTYKHFSNGGLTVNNYGYDFYGLKVNYLI